MTKCAVVTGAARGIGRAIANEFARAGYDVVAADVLPPVGGSLGGVHHVRCDITDPDDVARLEATVRERSAHVDVLINNAGIARPRRWDDLTVDELAQTLRVNAVGAFAVTRALTPLLASSLPGSPSRVVNVSSAAGDSGSPAMAAYGMSKAALNHLSRTTAAALADKNIAVTIVYPASVADGMWNQLPEGFAEVDGLSPDEVVSARLALTPGGAFQSAESVAEVVRWVAEVPGMALSGRTVLTDRWVL